MRKVLLTVIGGLITAALLASPAQATKPLVVEDIRFDGTTAVDPDLSEACGFEVSVSTTGHFRGTVYFDKDGTERLFTGHPSLSDTLTSPYASIETSDRGLDKISVSQDGTVALVVTDDAREGSATTLVLLDTAGNVLDRMPVTVGG